MVRPGVSQVHVLGGPTPAGTRPTDSTLQQCLMEVLAKAPAAAAVIDASPCARLWNGHEGKKARSQSGIRTRHLYNTSFQLD